jgi:hypothetical protein
MACPVKTSKGACRVASLHGDAEGRCWNHSPLAQERRAAARRQGGHARAAKIAEKKASAPAAPPPPPSTDGAFVLGALSDCSLIAGATTRVAQAVADGSMGLQRGRLLLEVLRAAHEAVFDVQGSASPSDGRDLTEAEAQYMITHHGSFPPGVRLISHGWIRVDGPIWDPKDGEREEAPEPEQTTNVIPFPPASAGSVA